MKLSTALEGRRRYHVVHQRNGTGEEHRKAPERHDDGQGLEAQDVSLLSTLNLSYPYHISTECTCQGDRDRVQADEGHGKGYPTGWLSCLRMSSGRLQDATSATAQRICHRHASGRLQAAQPCATDEGMSCMNRSTASLMSDEHEPLYYRA